MAQRESLYIDEEEAQVAEEDPLLTPSEPGVGVSQAPSGVVGVPAAPRGEVCAVEAGGLDEACGGEGLASPEPQRLPSEVGLDDAESVGAYAFFIWLKWASQGALSR